MAQIFAIASGNFNNSAIWSEGFVPTSADDVYANGFTVTLNTNATVNSLRNTASSIVVPFIATPAMTSNTAPSGISSVSSTSAGAAWNLFDQSLTSSWSSGVTNIGIVQYQFPTGKTIVRYAIYTGTTNGRQPATWTFEGSNNGSTWTTLHTVTGASLSISSWYNYTFTNTTSYTYYRLNVTATIVANFVQLNELQMTESSSAASGGAVGGSFVLPDGVTFTATNGIVAGNTTSVVTYSGTTSATLYTALSIVNVTNSILLDHLGTGTLIMYGNITLPSTTGLNGTRGVRVNSAGTFTLNGSFTGITSGGSGGIYCLEVTGNNSTININGGINGASISAVLATTIYCIFISGTSVNLNVTGNIVGGVLPSSGNTLAASAIYVTGSSTIVVVGNVSGGTAIATTASHNAHGIYSVAGTITINGDVTGGSGPTETVSAAIRTSGTVNITGTVSSGSCRAVFNEGNTNITVTGNVTANNSIAVSSAGTTSTTNIAGNVTAVNAPGVYASSTATNIITGNLTNSSSGFMAFWGQKLYLGTSGSRTWTFYNTSAAAKILYTGDLVSPAGSQPAVTDVRSGTVYALGTLTGTCAIPPRNSVTAGVPVDNGIGTALLTLSTMSSYAAAVWNTQTSALTTSGSIGERLKEASTVAITGQQIAGFDI